MEEVEEPPGPHAAAASRHVSTLPDDFLADILRRLPPRGLAVSRCVCKAWRDVVDGRRLLRADLLPLSLRGIILEYHEGDLPFAAFLSRPSAAGPDEIEIFAGVIPYSSHSNPVPVILRDHCNGLLLFEDRLGLLVSNPATKRWMHLPPPPPRSQCLLSWLQLELLVFDPADSPHYSVLLVPQSRRMEDWDKEPLQEWPPSTWVSLVFSSLTGKWEEKSFTREGGHLEMTSNKWNIPLGEQGQWTYCRGHLYVPCQAGTHSVLRILLSNHKYQAIKVPKDSYGYVLGRSENRVCLASMDKGLRIWILDESCGLMQWMLKHHIDLVSTISRVLPNDQRVEGPWMFQVFEKRGGFIQGMLHHVNNDEDDNSNRITEQNFEWDSDNDNVLDSESEADYGYKGFLNLFGFHPFKPIIFLRTDRENVLAFHLNTSKVQILGKVCQEYYDDDDVDDPEVVYSFLYTPCLVAEFP